MTPHTIWQFVKCLNRIKLRSWMNIEHNCEIVSYGIDFVKHNLQSSILLIRNTIFFWVKGLHPGKIIIKNAISLQ